MAITGTYPREYEVFMQFYSALVITVWDYTDQLCILLHKDHVITSADVKVIKDTPRSCRTQLLITELAMKLRIGNVTLFEKILRVIEMNNRDTNIQQLATEIRTTFDQDSMCLSSYVYFVSVCTSQYFNFNCDYSCELLIV